MIMLKYLVKTALKNQLSIFFILLLIFFCQKIVKILSAAVNSKISINLLFSLLGLGVPEMAQLILPLSLFLGLLITYGKLHTENEIIVMYACGFSKVILVKSAMILASFTGFVAAINVLWVKPLFSRHQYTVLTEAKINPGMMILTQGQFQQGTDDNSVLFFENVNGSHFGDAFLAQLHPKKGDHDFIIVANSGQIIQCKDGSQIIVLHKGIRFEGVSMLRNFRVINFQNYQAILGHQTVSPRSNDTEQMSIKDLMNSNTKKAQAELHWRMTLIVSVFLMALIVVPLSVENPRQSRVLFTFPAMFLYLVFFLLQILIKSNGSKGSIDPIFWVWRVNGFYLLLAVLLNLRGTTLMHRLRDFSYKNIRKIFNINNERP